MNNNKNKSFTEEDKKDTSVNNASTPAVNKRVGMSIEATYLSHNMDHEKRLTAIEIKHEELDKKVTENFAIVKEDIKELKAEVKEINNKINFIKDKIDNNLKWYIGIVLLPLLIGFIALYFK